MRELVNLNRRNFLKTSVAASAELVVGFTWPTKAAGVSSEQSRANTFAPNAFLRIDRAGQVTIWKTMPEMGQGVHTSLPMLVAEELEVNWSKVSFAMADFNSKYGSQEAGGSASVADAWLPLRRAGATAREMLITAASQVWSVERGSCLAEQGIIFHSLTGRRLAYGDLVDLASQLPVPSEVTLKDPKDFRLIGTRTKRIDTPAKVNGSATFGIDVQVPGMLYASLVQCPVFGAIVESFDAAAAKAVPGVKHVISIPGDVGANGGVAIVAESTWASIQGRRALAIKWNEGKNAQLSSAAISEMFRERAQGPGMVARNDGDVALAMSMAALRIDATYEFPYFAHATMEPMNCVADVRQESCEVWAPTQFLSSIHRAAVQLTKLSPKAVTVHMTLMGGGFGRRAYRDYAVQAIQISQAVGAPIKLLWSREDDLRQDRYHPAALYVISTGLDATGKIVAWKNRMVAPSLGGQAGAERTKNGMDEWAIWGSAVMPYDIPNVYIDYVMANTGVPIGAWRSMSEFNHAFVQECFIDELAAATKKDPYKLRLELLLNARETRYPKNSKGPLYAARLRGVLELAAVKAGWGEPLSAREGRGIAAFYCYGSYVAQVAEVAIGTDGNVRVKRVVCAIDCGMVVNPDTVEAQMQSAIVYGLTATLKKGITIGKGRVQERNYHDYPVLRINEMPHIEVHIVPSNENNGGVGEPGVPPIAPAVANAIFAATGRRIRRLPITADELKLTERISPIV